MGLESVARVWAPRAAGEVRAGDEWLLMVAEQLHARALEERAAGPVLHDVNNLMTALLYEVHSAIERARAGEDCLDALERVQSALKTAASITRGFAWIGRAKPGARSEVEVGKRLGALYSVLDAMASEQVSLALEIERELPRAAIKPEAFDRLILNLVGNAADAVGEAGSIRILARRVAFAPQDESVPGPGPAPGDYVWLTVQDDGCGMASEVAERAFKATFTTKPHGTGIGLALVARAVHRLGGAVGARSVPGIGTAIDAYLPAVPAGARRQHPAPGNEG